MPAASERADNDNEGRPWGFARRRVEALNMFMLSMGVIANLYWGCTVTGARSLLFWVAWSAFSDCAIPKE